MMVTYWDLDEKERSELSADDVQRYVDAELMLKGVLKVRPLELEPEPDMPTPRAACFTIRLGPSHYNDIGVAFLTLEDAKSFMALKPMQLSSEYLGSTSVSFTDAIQEPEFVQVPLFTKEEKDLAKVALKKACEIKAANEKRREEHTKAIRLQDEALRGLWEDWNECRSKAARLREVADTFADYQRTAGDDLLASKFLSKVYPAGLISEASARFGFCLPCEDIEP